MRVLQGLKIILSAIGTITFALVIVFWVALISERNDIKAGPDFSDNSKVFLR
jgi:hypothetical protein